MRTADVCWWARRFFPLCGWREAVEVEQGSAIYDMAEPDHTSEADQLPVIDLISAQQFGVVAEVAQEPVEFPQCSW